MKRGVLHSLLFICSWASSFAQPGEKNIYVHVFDADTNTIYFNDTIKSNTFLCDDALGNETSRNSCRINTKSGALYGPVIIKGEVVRFTVNHKGKKMKVEMVNCKPHSTISFIIDTLYFNPGNFELDCSKTLNEIVSHEIFGYGYDMTPHYWWTKDE